MPDDIDQVQELMETVLASQIASARKKAATLEVQGGGDCLECGDVLEQVSVLHEGPMPRWCCARCRDRWSAKQRALSQRGRE